MRYLGEKWGWILAVGILFIVLGIIALGMPVATTITAVTLFGILLLAGGMAELVEAYTHKDLWHLFLGILYLIAGGLVMGDPVFSSLTLTILLGGAIMALGIVRIVVGFGVKPMTGWGWLVVAGLVSLLLGMLILLRWPFSGLTVIGILIGLEMLIHGFSQVFLALLVRRLGEEE